MSTHTPGPWTNDRGLIRSKDGAIAGVVYDLDGDTPINYDVAQANAAFIVRACNSYEELVGALKQADNIIRNILTDSQLDQRTECGLTMRKYFSTVQAAIAKAEGRA